MPLLGALVFQKHVVITAANHTEARRRGVDHRTAECLAFGDARVRTLRGDDHARGVPAIDDPTATKQRQHHRHEAQQWPQRIAEKTAQADDVDRGPVLCAGAAQFEHQAVTVEIYPLIQYLAGPVCAGQDHAGRGDQGEVIVNRPLHQALDVVDLRQFQQRADHHPGIGALDGLHRLEQIDPDVGQQRRCCLAVLSGRVGHPMHLVISD
ncbi:hypothetical protein D3C81_1248370 [compost metagenome]